MIYSPNTGEAMRGEPKLRCAAHTFKVVFFYEDFDAAIECRKAFDSIARRFTKGRPIDSSSWSFSMLGSSEFNAAILMDASAAEVIVIAARGDRELPARVATWIEMCVNGCGKPAPVLIALHAHGQERAGEALPLCSSLESIASRQGAVAMYGGDLDQPPEEARPAAGLPWRAARSAGVLEPGTFPATGAHRWWGINE